MSDLRPPRRVWHGTDASFEAFDVSTSLGAHFGSRQAATDRLRDTGRLRIEYNVYEDDDGWMAEEETYGSRSGAVHGPFESEEAAQAFCEEHPSREPIEFEIDIYRPLQMPDEGVWTFEGMFSWLSRNHEAFGELHREVVWEAWNRSTEGGWTALKDALKALGHDSIVYRNETEDAGSLSWIVFDPERIHRVDDWREPARRPRMSEGR